MRIAAIDIGTNSVHLIMADIGQDRSLTVIEREKEMVRLGAGGLDGRPLTQAAMIPALQTLAKFKRLAEMHRADEIRATATSAVREAKNGGEFLAALERQTGIRARVISGLEEARLIHEAALYGVDTAGGRAVVIDIGGGTTEMTLGTTSGIERAGSFKLGAIRLTERFVKTDPLSASQERCLVRHIRSQTDAFLAEVVSAGFTTVIGTSGTILSVAGLAVSRDEGAGATDLHHRRVSAADVHRTRKLVVGLSLERRLRLSGLDPRRADLVVAGAILIDTILRRLGGPDLTLCDFALGEGIVLDFIRRHPDRLTQASQYPDIRRRSVVELAERCGVDRVHAGQVARLAVSMFDQSQTVHGLSERVREWLEYAALLHDAGDHISYAGHHKHSYYLIRNGGLRGFDPDEIEAVALIARYHRRGAPRKSHPAFAALSGTLRRAVRVASAVLRVAEGLDRSHQQAVDQVDLRHQGAAVALVLHVHDDVELEVWAAGRQSGPLEKVLGKRVRIDTGSQSHAEHTHHASPASGQAVRR